MTPILASLLSLVIFLPGLTWGLPSREADRFLFGDREPWTGAELEALAGTLDADAAADVDRDAASGEDRWLNDTDAERAEIVIRYRLYSQQPDEMLTLRAIASMAARRSPDPQFYTYGGLWTYPVAALIGTASVTGLIERGGLAFYLDQPDEFAKMYVVARLYAVAWAAVGAGVVCAFAMRLARNRKAGLLAALLYATMPVVVVAAHEAKPHLPGAVLALAAALFADAYQRSGRRRDVLVAGAFCGAATGMVVTMAVSFLVLPLAAWQATWAERWRSPDQVLRPSIWRRIAVPTLLGLAIFAITNPFLLLNPAAALGNAANTAGHYGIDETGFWPAGMWFSRVLQTYLVAAGGVGAVGYVIFALVLRRDELERPFRSVQLLGVLAVASAATYALTSFGRPPDHARFAILACVASVVALGVWMRPAKAEPTPKSLWHRPLVPAWVTCSIGLAVLLWLSWWPFVANAWGIDGRHEAADELAALYVERGEVAVSTDPAPYAVPPFDLWKWSAIKRRDGLWPMVPISDEATGVLMRPAEREDSAYGLARQIGWAQRDFEPIIISPRRAMVERAP